MLEFGYCPIEECHGVGARSGEITLEKVPSLHTATANIKWDGNQLRDEPKQKNSIRNVAFQSIECGNSKWLLFFFFGKRLFKWSQFESYYLIDPHSNRICCPTHPPLSFGYIYHESCAICFDPHPISWQMKKKNINTECRHSPQKGWSKFCQASNDMHCCEIKWRAGWCLLVRGHQA